MILMDLYGQVSIDLQNIKKNVYNEHSYFFFVYHDCCIAESQTDQVVKVVFI